MPDSGFVEIRFISLLHVRVLSPLDPDSRHQEHLAKYLNAGHVINLTKIQIPNQFDATLPSISYGYLTDGSWVWSTELAAYSALAPLSLPPEFVEHVLLQNATMPGIDPARLEFLRRVHRGEPV